MAEIDINKLLSGLNEGTADKFIGGHLYGLKPISIYSNASNGTLIKTVPANTYVGEIYSYVHNKNNNSVWWSIDVGGKHAGFVLHESGKFDKNKLLDSLVEQEYEREEEIEKKADERKENNPFFNFDFSKILGQLGGWVTAILILLIIFMIVK